MLRAEPDGELDQPVIEERNARFDTVRHAAAILPMQKHRQVGRLSHRDTEIANILDCPQAVFIERDIESATAAIDAVESFRAKPVRSYDALPARRPQEPDQ